MIPHVVFLLRDGLKAYFGWVSQVLRSKHVPKLCNKHEVFLSYKRGHLFFAAGAFSQTKCSKNHEHMRISRTIIKICHIFFAAGAFSQKNVQKNMKIYLF